MRTTVKVLAILSIVLGGFAILGCVDEFDGAAFIGGLLFGGTGIVNLCFLRQVKEVEEPEIVRGVNSDCNCGCYHDNEIPHKNK